MLQKEFTIKDPGGLHLRVAAGVVEITRTHSSQVRLSLGRCEGCHKADGCSILDILTLGAPQGTTVTIRADGPDESEVISDLGDYFENGGGI